MDASTRICLTKGVVRRISFYCGADEEDAATHTLCMLTMERLSNKLSNHHFTEQSMMAKLLESEYGWNSVYSVVRLIIETKVKEST